MAETYCGKSCADCAAREPLDCSGCRSGPGNPFGGDCELAKCARDKGHETCETCGHISGCRTLRKRERMPDYRMQEIEAEQKKKAELARRAPILGKWLWIIFWLFIPSAVSGLMSHETTTNLLPALHIPGEIISAVCALAYGAILLKLRAVEYRYRTAGICALIAAAVSGGAAVVNGITDGATWILVFTIPAAIVALVGEHNEYMAHAAVLTGVDDELSGKWETLWKWYIRLFVGLFGCILIILILPLLGLLAVLAAAIGITVVSVLKLIYLYRTAKAFRSMEAGPVDSTF